MRDDVVSLSPILCEDSAGTRLLVLPRIHTKQPSTSTIPQFHPVLDLNPSKSPSATISTRRPSSCDASAPPIPPAALAWGHDSSPDSPVMAIGGSPNNPRRCSDAVEHMSDHPVDGEPPTKKRRIFLQTMGQQLRDVNMTRESPSDHVVGFAPGASDTSHSRSVEAVFPPSRAPSRQVQIQTPESDAVPGEDDHLPTGASISASKQIWQPGEVAVDPSHITFEDLLSWTQSYFDNWHPAYPFLHAPSLLKYFHHIARIGGPDPTSPPSFELVILKSIMSISLADRRQTGTVMRSAPANLVFNSFNDSIHSIQQALAQESSIESLQAIVSVQLFLMSMLRYNAASRLQGLAARMAFQLGLHRCPMRYSAFPRDEAQLRKRLFWSMYCIDRYICIRLCIPQAIRDHDVDVCWPTSEQHGETNSENSDYDDRLDLLIFLSRHAEIRGLIMDLRNRSDSQSQVETDEAVTINAELTKWWNDVEEYLESSSMALVPISRYHEVTLVVLRHEAIIALNKHTLATAGKPSTYNAALQNCIGASRSIINALHKALDISGKLNSSAASDDPEDCALFWPSFTWGVWMSAFIMIYAANEDQAPQDVATRLADRSLDIFKHLALRGSVWPNACAAAIQDLRGQLIERRNQVKNANPVVAEKSKAPNSEGSRRPLRGSIPLESDRRPDDAPPTPNTAATAQWAAQGSERSAYISHYPGPQMRQDSTSIRDIINPPEYNSRTPIPSTIVSTPGSVSRVDSSSSQPALNQPLPVRQSWGFPDFPNPATYINMGLQPGIGQQLMGIPMLNDDGTEIHYGLDMPFWTNNGQWQRF
ncbi:hypothetical protein B7463_g12591, partial [Scytalidium lignicola]